MALTYRSKSATRPTHPLSLHSSFSVHPFRCQLNIHILKYAQVTYQIQTRKKPPPFLHSNIHETLRQFPTLTLQLALLQREHEPAVLLIYECEGEVVRF